MPDRDVDSSMFEQNSEPGHSAGDEAAISAKDVTVRLRDDVVMDGLNLEVRKGEILGLVGASGSGKSVLLDVLLGLLKPERGTIHILGQDISSASDVERKRLTMRWGVVFQQNALFSTMSVAENIAVVLRNFTSMPEQLINEIASLKMSLAELPPASANQKPSELSVGMRKRAALARALALDPPLLLLDEPTTGLDPLTAAALDDLLLKLHRALGNTVFLITHDLDTLYRVCDRIAVLVNKKIAAIGTTAELEQSTDSWIHEYFGGDRAKAAAASAARAVTNARKHAVQTSTVPAPTG